jgi:hypothetical protein
MMDPRLEKVEALCLEAQTEMARFIHEVGTRHIKLLVYWSIFELIELASKKLGQLLAEAQEDQQEPHHD